MSFAIQSEKAKLASFQQKTRELTNRLEVIGALEVDLRGLIDLEHSIQDQRAKTEEAKRSKSALEARLEGRQIESQGLAAKLEQLQRQLQNASHKLARQEETRKSMRERGARRIDELKAEWVDQGLFPFCYVNGEILGIKFVLGSAANGRSNVTIS